MINPEVKNKLIVDAIHISQMMDSEGFKIYKKWLEDREKQFQFQDILGLKDDQTIRTQQGITLDIIDNLNYFNNQKLLAEKQMIDLETGLPEVLNKKKPYGKK